MSKNSTNNKKNHSIRISDEDFKRLNEKAKAVNLSFSSYMVKRGLDELETISPDIICRLKAILNILTLPPEAMNDVLRNKYKEDLEIICSRLF